MTARGKREEEGSEVVGWAMAVGVVFNPEPGTRLAMPDGGKDLSGRASCSHRGGFTRQHGHDKWMKKREERMEYWVHHG